VGAASSHAPSLFTRTYEGWQRLQKVLSPGVPQPPAIEDEGPEAVAGFVARTERAFEKIRSTMIAARPDVVVVISGDQDEWFDASLLPAILIYAGTDDIVGFHNYGAADHEPRLLPWEHPERFGVRFRVDQRIADYLLDGLVRHGFDVAISRKIPEHPQPQRAGPHALTRPLPLILPHMDVPIVPIMIKTVERSPVFLSGERCLALGRAIEALCRSLPSRVAIFGSGGMSHDPLGPRSGWVDEPLDRWFLRELANGTPDKLGALYSFRSAATESGTGELRTWLPVAAAMDAALPGARATIVDYFPSVKSTCGNGWVVWPALSSSSLYALS
jgi:hypothetical protein